MESLPKIVRKPRSPALFITKWALGFTASIFITWAVTAVFSSNIVPEEWSPELERNVRASGWTISERNEGWASSSVHDLGLIGVSDPGIRTKPKVVIWGDSFVDAIQVDDPDKMHLQLSNLLDPKGGVTAVAVGEPWWSFADYVFRIPTYETVLKNTRLHVIHLYSLEDTFPDQYPGARVSLFLSEPELHLEKYDNEWHELEAPRIPSRISDTAYRLRLHFFLHFRSRLERVIRLDGLRFKPGVQRSSGGELSVNKNWNRYFDPAWGSAEPPLEAWRFLLGKLDAATEAPILVIYAPPTPTLAGGSLVLENPEKNLVAHFSAVCRDRGIGFVSLEEPFRRYWMENGRFPNGFSNTRPWEGHYNADGHRLAAEAINIWIKENHHVVYPD